MRASSLHQTQKEAAAAAKATRIAADMRFNEMIVSSTYCVDRQGDTQFRGDERTQLRWGDARC